MSLYMKLVRNREEQNDKEHHEKVFFFHLTEFQNVACSNDAAS